VFVHPPPRLFAKLLPARRAARIDPLITLRADWNRS
jgi:hypothetical protein